MKRTKYHRTYHLPWSHLHDDDKALSSLDHFKGEDVVVLKKMDGENTSIYSDGFLHARSLDSRHNFTRDWIKKMSSILRFDIPDHWRFVFENVAYYHSISYTNLRGFAYLLSIWDNTNTRIAYDDMMEYAILLDLPTPDVLYRGVFDEAVLRNISATMDLVADEGYVVTVTKPVHASDISTAIAKFVRDDHCQPNKDGVVEHWLKNTYPNKIDLSMPVKPSYMA